MKKKYIVFIVIISIFILIAPPIFQAISIEKEIAADYVIKESISPDKTHTIKVIGNGQPKWSFGSQKISIKIDNLETILSTEIGNDGKEAIVKDIVWSNNNSAYIEIYGRQPRCTRYAIEFDETGSTLIEIMPPQ